MLPSSHRRGGCGTQSPTTAQTRTHRSSGEAQSLAPLHIHCKIFFAPLKKFCEGFSSKNVREARGSRPSERGSLDLYILPPRSRRNPGSKPGFRRLRIICKWASRYRVGQQIRAGVGQGGCQTLARGCQKSYHRQIPPGNLYAVLFSRFAICTLTFYTTEKKRKKQIGSPRDESQWIVAQRPLSHLQYPDTV